MVINYFELSSFRNHENSKLELSPKVNVISGNNGEGKTNILEGIMLFAAGKSFRGQKDREMIMFGSDSAYMKLNFTDKYSTHTLEAYLYKNKKRVLYRDGAEIKKLSDFLGLFRAVIFTPDHLKIIKSSPDNRRHLLDVAICQSYPRFVSFLSDYNRILLQKNNLLKSGVTELSLPMIDVYNESLSKLSAVISLNRYNYSVKLSEKANEYLKDMTSGKEDMKIVYSCRYGKDMTKEVLSENCLSAFEKKKNEEIQKRLSLVGCHHDDFIVYLSGKDAKLYASQGQQRSIVLALKLAEGDLMKNYTGEDGVFLFDDVLSELDEKRKEYITEKLKDRQFIITNCDNTVTANRLFNIKNGKTV